MLCCRRCQQERTPGNYESQMPAQVISACSECHVMMRGKAYEKIPSLRSMLSRYIDFCAKQFHDSSYAQKCLHLITINFDILLHFNNVIHYFNHFNYTTDVPDAHNIGLLNEYMYVICIARYYLVYYSTYFNTIEHRGSLKIEMIQNWVQVISPCSQWLARCHVTRQRCSAAPAPKLSATERHHHPSSPEVEEILLARLAKSWRFRELLFEVT